MRFMKTITIASPFLAAGAVFVGARLTASSQESSHIHAAVMSPTGGENYRCEVKIEEKDGYRYITSNGIPDHATGTFPNRGNPNRIAPQNYHFRTPLHPKPSDREYRGQIFGVAINGVVFDPGTAELWNGDFRWHYEALTGLLGGRGKLGADDNFAHVQPNGAYHYHGLPMGLLNRLDYKHRMALVGYAADGYPIYGPYVYSDPHDAKSPLMMVRSGYRIKDGNRPGGNEGPGGACDGSFASDFEYVRGTSDLDECNGRSGVTPEYPKGTYYYVLTENWPFVPRKFHGMPDSSFQKGPGGPGPGGPGGPGFGQGGPGGFGGPGGPGRGPGGPPRGMVPGDYLSAYLGLSADQKLKLERLMKAVDALGRENFAIPALSQLKLTEEQIRKIAEGGKVRSVLTAEQQKVLESNQRPGFPGGPGGPGGPGFGPGGPGGFGGPDGPPPPGE